MPTYSQLIRELFAEANGQITITDRNGRTFTHDNPTALGAWAADALDPVLDLVTDEGEAVGLFVPGNAKVVEPQPSLTLDHGMIYLVDGTPVSGQESGFHMCPLDIFLDGEGEVDLMRLSWFLPSEVKIVTPGSRCEITLMNGRNRQEGQGKWKPLSSTFGQFSDALRAHKVGEKDGPCFLQGESADGARKSSAQIANHILGVDLDSGAPLADVIKTIQQHGLEAVIYTTHSHMKDTTQIKRDHFMKVMDTSEAKPDLIRTYLMEWKGILPHIVENIEVLDDAHHTAEGVVILAKHNPIPKFRAVFPLSEGFVFAKRGGSQQDAILEWKERYAGFCTDLKFFFDEKCVDPARLFYLPRHRKTDTQFGSWAIAGDALDLDKFSRIKVNRKRRKPGQASGPQNAFTAVGDDDEDDADRYITETGFNLRRWSSKYATKFEVETMLEQVVGDDFIRDPRRSGKPGTHVECPFEAEHSSFGGGGTFVVNAGDNQADGFDGGFTFTCVHAACTGRDRLDMLKELLEQNVITEANLTDTDFLVEMDKEDEGVKAITPSSSDINQPSPAPLSEEEQVLTDLNERYAVLIGKNSVSVLMEPEESGGQYQILSEQSFNLLERNRTVLRFPAKGEPKSIQMSQEWLAWGQRRLFKGMNFYPEGNAPSGIYNTFNGWSTRAISGEWGTLKHHLLNNICEGHECRDEYFRTWLADIVQNPGEKAGVATVLTGAKGCGKSKAFDWMRVLLGRYAVKISQADGITGKFNAHQEDKLLLVGDEAVRSIDSRTDAIIKDMITSRVVQIEGKGRDQREVNNFMRLAMLSNDDHVVRATLDERRYFVLRCGDGNIQDQKFFAELDREMRNGGVEAMMYDLMHHVPKNGWASLRRPPITPYLRNQQVLTLNALDRFIVDLVREEGYVSEDGVHIDLHNSSARTHSCHALRIAANDYQKTEPLSERVRADYTALCIAAKRMLGASDAMGERDGNRGRLITFPPLREARKYLSQNHGIEITPPPEIELDKHTNVVTFHRKAG